MKIYFDGGCVPNPGLMKSCFVVDDGRKHIFDKQDLGYGTNNIAEWLAMVDVMRYCVDNRIINPEILGDSSLVVNQANGLWKVKKDNLKPYKAEYDSLVSTVKPLVRYIPRARNLAGNFLEFGRL